MGREDFNIEDYIPTEDSISKGYDNKEFYEEWDKVNEQLDKDLVIAFLGTASSGKTTGIKTLFGIDFGDVSPIPGSTKEVKVKAIPGNENVYLVDAPGFGDIQVEISQKAKEVCEKVDIFIYVLNAEGGYKLQEKEDYHDILKYNKEVLVVLNKIDLFHSEKEKEEFIEDQRKKMGVEHKDFIPVAFAPHPKISPTPINVDKVQDWIQNTLEQKGKDLLFAKVVREKDKICSKWIKTATASAATIGALPIPGSDYIPLTACQAGMTYKIAVTYGYNPTMKDIKNLLAGVFAGQIGKQVFRGILTLLKTAGWIPGPTWAVQVAISALAASVAASTTYGLGKGAQAYYKSGMQIPIVEIQEIFKNNFDEYRKTKEGD